MKINLGSGHLRFDGFLNIDEDPNCNPDYIIDLEKELLPFPDNSVDEVKAHHILEHIGDNFIPLIQDIYRVCKHNAIVDIRVPHHQHETFYSDPTHKRPITIGMLATFSKKKNMDDFEYNGSVSGFGYKYNVDFEMIHHEFTYDHFYSDIVKDVNDKKNAGLLTPEEEFAYMRLMREATNVAIEVKAILKVIKNHKTVESTTSQDLISAVNSLSNTQQKNIVISHFYETIEGWFNFNDVYEMVVDRYPDGSHFVEVGVWKGKSTAFMAVEIANSGKHIKFDCIDNFVGSDEEAHKNDIDIQNGTLYETFINNMRPVEGYYNAIKMDSVEASKLYEDRSLDFVLLDASHDCESVKRDIIAWYPKIKVGGILAGDDYGWDTVRKTVHELLINKGLMTNGYSWLITKKDINLC